MRGTRLLSFAFFGALLLWAAESQAICLGENVPGCGAISCCSGLSCVSSVCVDTSSCQSSGQFCSSSGQCCSGLSCVGGFCGASCQGEGDLCTTSSQCCGDRVCHLGMCRTQPEAGETCSLLGPSCAGDLVCDIDGLELRCRHDPPIVGEACSVFVPCSSGLVCNGLLTCQVPKKIGESCSIFDRCASGLSCTECLPDGVDQAIEGCESGRACFPDLLTAIGGLPSESECLSWYSAAKHAQVMSNPPDRSFSGALTYATGGQVAGGDDAIIGGVGAVYGVDGRYGCFESSCRGAELDLAAELFTSIGNYETYSSVGGKSNAAVIEASSPVLNYSKTGYYPKDVVFPLPGLEFGVEAAVSVGLGVSPIPASIGFYACDTELVTAVGNGPPTARCADTSVCANGQTCVASASIDDGSSDPDGDAITLTLAPPGPYPIGVHTLSLTAEDPFGETDSCSADLSVEDCTPPVITCPPAVVVECTGNGQAPVDPGDATATDCSVFTVTDPGPGSYPLGTTSVDYTATDAAGNQSSCQTEVTVRDTTPPAIQGVAATPDQLWPPNHKLHTIAVAVSASDTCDPDSSCAVIGVVSNEPDAGLDADDVPGDTEIVDAATVRVRAERASEGSGRVYTIRVECRDATGNASQGTVPVYVAHDARDGDAKPGVRRSR